MGKCGSRLQSASLFLENYGETQNKRRSLTVTVTELSLVVWASEVEPTSTLLAGHANVSRLQAYLFCVPPHGFSRKREIDRSLCWKATIPGVGHLPSFFVPTPVHLDSLCVPTPRTSHDPENKSFQKYANLNGFFKVK